MEDVDIKPEVTHQISYYAQHTETTDTKMPSVPWTRELPMKTGEVFRNNDGQYSFMCFHCGLIFENFGNIVKHCELHYQDENHDTDMQSPDLVGYSESPHSSTESPATTTVKMEFVLCAETDAELPPRIPAKVSKKPSKLSKRTAKSIPQRNVPLPNIPQNCPICRIWCDDFRNHMKTTHGFLGRICQCYICKAFFKSVSTLSKHINSDVHNTNTCYHCAMEPPITDASQPRRHKCLFCKEWFANHVEFKIHFKDAHDKDANTFFSRRKNCNVFTCYVCEREFPLRYYLTAHMRTHHEKFLRHQCPTCGRRLRTYGQLTQHLKTHEGRTFTCDLCKKSFGYYAALRLHRLSHNTELNYQCDECPKAFKLRTYLTKHKAVHKNAKKYGCKFCDRSFNFTSGRRAHEKSQHGAL